VTIDRWSQYLHQMPYLCGFRLVSQRQIPAKPHAGFDGLKKLRTFGLVGTEQKKQNERGACLDCHRQCIRRRIRRL
jgi:hypothetical protein